jgi:hypothetical protein
VAYGRLESASTGSQEFFPKRRPGADLMVSVQCQYGVSMVSAHCQYCVRMVYVWCQYGVNKVAL